MPTTTDRKIMMLNRIITRLTRQKATLTHTIRTLESNARTNQDRITRLISRVRGDGPKAQIPDDSRPCYDYTLTFVAKYKYGDKARISMFKDPKYNEIGSFDAKGQIVIDWIVEKLDEDIYDLVLVKEWVYGM